MRNKLYSIIQYMKVMAIEGFPRLLEALSVSPGVELTVLDRPEQLKRLEAEGITCRMLPFSTRAKLDPWAIAAVHRAIREVAPDIVHSFTSRGMANAVLATYGLRNAPGLVSFRGAASVTSRHDWGFRLAYANPRIGGHACASDAVRQAMIESGISPEKCMTTYNCICTEGLERPGRPALAEWGIPADAFVVGTVAVIRPVKGIDVLLKAALECAGMENVYWVLIGPLHDSAVARLAGDNRIKDRVRLTGLRRDAKALMSGMDLFVMPSRAEGLCLALMEAMAQGVCPVVSDAGGMKEVVRHGVDGLVVPREDVPALAGAIRLLYADRQKVAAFSESSRNRITETFTPARVADRTLALYHRVMLEKKGTASFSERTRQ
jgi:glycosyltransferase involved in cell wall biosynthesis